jgi:hypothetical protein
MPSRAAIPRKSALSCFIVTFTPVIFWSAATTNAWQNAKEIHVDAASGQILTVQTERPEDQAEEPPNTH